MCVLTRLSSISSGPSLNVTALVDGAPLGVPHAPCDAAGDGGRPERRRRRRPAMRSGRPPGRQPSQWRPQPMETARATGSPHGGASIYRLTLVRPQATWQLRTAKARFPVLFEPCAEEHTRYAGTPASCAGPRPQRRACTPGARPVRGPYQATRATRGCKGPRCVSASIHGRVSRRAHMPR